MRIFASNLKRGSKEGRREREARGRRKAGKGERQGREQERKGGFFIKRASACARVPDGQGRTPGGLVPNAKTACVFVRKKTADF